MKPRLDAYLYIAVNRWLKRINPTPLGIVLLLLASATLIGAEYLSLRATLVADISVQARIIAENSTAALAFQDKEGISDILSALRVSDQIERAVIVDRQNRVQASFLRSPDGSTTLGNGGIKGRDSETFDAGEYALGTPSGKKAHHRFSLTHLYLTQSIAGRDRTLGYIYIKARLSPMYRQLAAFLGAALIALPVFGALGASLLALGRLRTKVSKAQDRLYQLAYVDTVTGLPNRNVFNQRLTQALAKMHREAGRLALLFLDLDNFKYINDTFGHLVGDKLLLGVTNRLAGSLRSTDLLCRLGGDEFALILEDIGNRQAAADAAHRLIENLRPPFDLEGREVYVSTSIGISLFPDDGSSLEFLLKSADSAMYHAKELGRNNFQFYSSELNERSLRRLELESGLRRALSQDEFRLLYQPILDLESLTVTTLEALIRWDSPEGPIHPDEFIPVAEDCGMILPIAQWALRQACVDLGSWHHAGKTRYEVAVNLSTQQFRDPNLVGTVSGILAETGTPPQSLWLEITETTLMADTAATFYKLHELTLLGVRLAVDDFGTGYSSLSYLKKLPLAKLKIDRSFIADIPTDGDAVIISEAILAMARSLRLKTVAEGVETAEQIEFLRQRGCDAVQGYLIARPTPAESVAEMVRNVELEAVKGLASNPRVPESLV